MTEQPKDPHLEQMAASLGQIQQQVRELKQMPAAALAQYAATPKGRETMMANRAHFLAYRQLLAAAVRDLADVDRLMDKALRKSRWSLRA